MASKLFSQDDSQLIYIKWVQREIKNHPKLFEGYWDMGSSLYVDGYSSGWRWRRGRRGRSKSRLIRKLNRHLTKCMLKPS
jgi:hypothetical protein